MTFGLVALILFLSAALIIVSGRWIKARREQYIRTYTFPKGLLDKLVEKRPGLELKDQHLVTRALRQYFLAHLKCNLQFVSMPSQITDELWHEFILYTRNYQLFCKKAFGQYMHHTPAVVMGASRHNNEGLRRVWWHCCIEENINPKKSSRLPLLFAIDSKLGIANGFVYAPDCAALRKNNPGGAPVHCGNDFSSPRYDGSTIGYGDSYPSSSFFGSSDSVSAGGDSGGDSSSGCGGGCSGGGD
jgi:hypothetical protein